MRYIVVFKKDSGVFVCAEPEFKNADLVASFITALRQFLRETLKEKIESIKLGSHWLIIRDAGELTVALVSPIKHEELADMLANKLKNVLPTVPDIITSEIIEKAKQTIKQVLEETFPYDETREVFNLIEKLPPVCPHAKRLVNAEIKRAEKDSDFYSKLALSVIKYEKNVKHALECIKYLSERNIPTAFKHAIRSGSPILALHSLSLMAIVKGFVPSESAISALLAMVDDKRVKVFLEGKMQQYFGIKTNIDYAQMRKVLLELRNKVNTETFEGTTKAALFLPTSIFSAPPKQLSEFISDFEKEVAKIYLQVYEVYSDVMQTVSWKSYSEKLDEILMQMITVANDFLKNARSYPEKAIASITAAHACEVYSTQLITFAPPLDTTKTLSEKIAIILENVQKNLKQLSGKGISCISCLSLYNASLLSSIILRKDIFTEKFARYSIKAIPISKQNPKFMEPLARSCYLSIVARKFGIQNKFSDAFISLFPVFGLNSIIKIYKEVHPMLLLFWITKTALTAAEHAPKHIINALEKMTKVIHEELQISGITRTFFDIISELQS